MKRTKGRPVSPNITAFGLNLKKVRKENSWSQEQLAAHLGISRSLLGSYEEGRAYPHVDRYLQIAEKLKINDVAGFLRDPSFSLETNRALDAGGGISRVEQSYVRLSGQTKQAVDTLLGL